MLAGFNEVLHVESAGEASYKVLLCAIKAYVTFAENNNYLLKCSLGIVIIRRHTTSFLRL